MYVNKSEINKMVPSEDLTYADNVDIKWEAAVIS